MRLHRASTAVSLFNLTLHPPSKQANYGGPYSLLRACAVDGACAHRDAVRKIKARPLSEPGLHNQSLRIPMAFTAHSQRIHWGRVPIASSEVAPFYRTRDHALLGRTLVVFKGPLPSLPPTIAKWWCLNTRHPGMGVVPGESCRACLHGERAKQAGSVVEDGRERASFPGCTPWLKDMILFALNMGMRMGEIRELTWEGVDLFRKTVTVFQSKNGERRTIPINSVVLDVLKRKAKVRSIKSNYVFPSDTYTLLDDSHLRRAFRGAMKLCRIENFHFHDLRHTFATRLVQSGIDLYKVQCLLGHKSPIMTQRYAHHYPESLREVVEILARYSLHRGAQI